MEEDLYGIRVCCICHRQDEARWCFCRDKNAVYCSIECQREGWQVHKRVCSWYEAKIKSRTQRYFNTQTTTAQHAYEQAIEFQRDMQSAPGEMVTLEESAACTDEIEVQAEAHMQSLTVVLDDGYGAQVGCQASRALLVKTLAVQRDLERGVYRHGRATDDEPGSSIPLQKRILGNLFPHGAPLNPRTEGDDIDLLFRLFLSQIEERGYVGRMPIPPLVSTNPVKLHDHWWTKFTKKISWGSMTLEEKQRHVRKWLFQKFTLDPKGQCMNPGPGSKRLGRNEAKWEGFWLNDAELEELVKSIFLLYETQY